MYSVNDTVLYAQHGVCIIEQICRREFMGETGDYYKLRPVAEGHATVFVPVGNPLSEKKMKPVLTKGEVIEMIHSLPAVKTDWIENSADRKRRCTDILREGDRSDLLRMVKSLYIHKTELEGAGKKFHASDERALKEGEKLLYDEFAHVLQIGREEVLPFICKELERE
ncbi:MAG: CarD family transcriptional regulator [Clostridia bacterium]|nr:CarD family transcriptional regulator [Clostridia bacterium]MBQ4574593.1 CarD family transcriptional regulator [Clostridia bacterium]